MTLWDGLILLMLAGITVVLLRGHWQSPTPTVVSAREPPEWVKLIVIVAILLTCGFMGWHAFQDPMSITSSQRVGMSGPQGPVLQTHNYVLGVFSLAVPVWMGSAFFSKRLRQPAEGG